VKEIGGVRARTATAFLAISAADVTFQCLEFMLEALKENFSMTSNETVVLSQVSFGSCLLVVFLAGVLADRLGDRLVLMVSSGVLCFGASLFAIAPNDEALIIGQAVCGIGTIAMSIIGLSVLNKNYSDTAQRAKAFGLFAVITPIVAVVSPLFASVMITHLGWRSVTTTWIILGLSVFFLAKNSLPKVDIRSDKIRSDNTQSERIELLTPTLAGIALAGIALTFSFLEIDIDSSAHSPAALVSLIVGVMALILLVGSLRRVSKPTLDIRSLRPRGALSLVTALFVVNGVNFFFYTFLMLQYRYHQTLLETAVFLIAPNITATFGAIISGRLTVRWGSARVSLYSLLAASFFSLSALAVSAESSAWWPVAVLSIVALPIGAGVGPVTQTFMELSPADGAASASAFRNSAVNLGGAIGGLLLGASIFNRIDIGTAQNIEAYQKQADAFHLAGYVCAVAYFIAAMLIVLYSKRRRLESVLAVELGGI
jgi:DHA2 family methylenomycin A resistance protein-like MFS transporter